MYSVDIKLLLELGLGESEKITFMILLIFNFTIVQIS